MFLCFLIDGAAVFNIPCRNANYRETGVRILILCTKTLNGKSEYRNEDYYDERSFTFRQIALFNLHYKPTSI